MNRLVLVGNGFDLAHGLQTSYSHFILWYIKQCMETGRGMEKFEDQLIVINCQLDQGMRFYDAHDYRPPEEMSISDFIDHCHAQTLLFQAISGEEITLPAGRTFSYPYSITIKSPFFKKLLENFSEKRWVDIENEFYEHLKSLLHHDDDSYVQKALPEINADMEFIIELLHKYLVQLPSAPEVHGYGNVIRRPVSPDAMPLLSKDYNYSLENVYVLNFNYTSTIEQYTRYVDNVKVNYIHGQLRRPVNPIIFGFGDELDEEYKAIEHSKIKGFFKYIKSFWYFKTNQYHDLIRFIESDSFEVVVLGHSCGLSDRTMLSMIFNHNNCMGIWIYYHGNVRQNNYTELTEEISRHFTDKELMRKKVIPKPLCESMPQYS